MTDFSALAGAGVFLLRKKKGTKEIRPITTCPKNGQAPISNFANGSVQLASMLDEPQNSSMNFDPTKVENWGRSYKGRTIKNAFYSMRQHGIKSQLHFESSSNSKNKQCN